MAAQKRVPITFRVHETAKDKFIAKAAKLGIVPSQFLREIIDAACDDRLRIVNKKDQSITIKGVHVDVA